MIRKLIFRSGSKIKRPFPEVMIWLGAIWFLSSLTATVAEASQEYRLSFSKFHLESENEAGPGLIIITGSRDRIGNFQELKVKFLGKDIDVPQSILEKIPASTNGIQISGDAGYVALGGNTVYIVFLTGWSIEPTPSKRTTVAVTADGKSSIIQY